MKEFPTFKFHLLKSDEFCSAFLRYRRAPSRGSTHVASVTRQGALVNPVRRTSARRPPHRWPSAGSVASRGKPADHAHRHG